MPRSLGQAGVLNEIAHGLKLGYSPTSSAVLSVVGRIATLTQGSKIAVALLTGSRSRAGPVDERSPCFDMNERRKSGADQNPTSDRLWAFAIHAADRLRGLVGQPSIV